MMPRIKDARPSLEALESRELLSATPAQIALALTHSAEYYSWFVTSAYESYLDRRPEAAGLAGWVGAMQSGLSDERLEASFIGSAEYIRQHGGQGAGWVRGLYGDLLGRAPTQAEVDGWVSALGRGAGPQQVAYGFAASAEREGMRASDDYFTYLGRSPSQAEVNARVSAFGRGVSNEDIIAGFVGSPEYFNKAGGQADVAQWLLSAYRDVLGRVASEAEVRGWVGAPPGVLGARVVQYAEQFLGRTAPPGSPGDCTDLAIAALQYAGAKTTFDLGVSGPDADYVWGTSVYQRSKWVSAGGWPSESETLTGYPIAAGDIIQYRDVTVESHSPDGSWSRSTFPHHTAIIEAVLGPGKYLILEQNWNNGLPDGRVVRQTTLNLNDMTQGSYWIYQPVAK